MKVTKTVPRATKAQAGLFFRLAQQALEFGRCRVGMDFQGAKPGQIHMMRVEPNGAVSVASFDDSRVDPSRENFRTLGDFARVYELEG